MKKIACRYAIVQFSPYTETGEFANVGVVLACPQTGFFGFKLQNKKYARVTAFFSEIDGGLYRAAVRALETEMLRLTALAHQADRPDRADLVRQLFTGLVHPREAIIRFGQARAVLADDPAQELEQLFNYYVGHSFAMPEYIEQTMTKRLQVLLNQLNLAHPFRQAILGDDAFHVNFQLVQKDELDQPRKVIKAFNLDQREPNLIYGHGDVWVPRIKRLVQRQLLPKATLFTVALPPQHDARRYNASQEIVRGLQEARIVVLSQTAEDQIREFAQTT